MFSLLRISTLTLIIITTVTSLGAYAEHKTYQKTSESGVLFTLTVESDKPEPMKPLPISISVSDPEGTPVSGIIMNCSLTMPAMAMARNTPTIKETVDAGQYESIFLLTMGGLWEVELTSVYDSGKKEVVVIAIPDINSGEKGSGVDSKLEELFHEKNTSHN